MITCTAALDIKGEHFFCDWPVDEDGTHSGWAHSNRDAEAIWTDDPAVLTAAWAGAEKAGR